MPEYSIINAFKRIEALLVKSMLDNFEKHKVQQINEGKEWTMWQRLQLKALERYRKKNALQYDSKFKELNRQIEALFKGSYDESSDGAFGLNDDKLDALVTATVDDITKAEHAILRKANDEYRKIIFNAMTYANAGGTYEQAIDMATKDFLRQGITSIVYKNGARHTISDYASMAIKTGSKRAYLMGLGNKMNEMGVHTVRVNKRNGACPYCARWIGRVLVDDVYSGGTRAEAREKGYPLLSEAMEEGFLHPNCKDIYSIYIEGVSKPEEPPTKAEIQQMVDVYNREQEERRAKDKATSYGRLADYSLSDKQREHYRDLEEKWIDIAEEQPYTVVDLETSLREVEDGIRDKPYEWFVSFDDDGNVLFNATEFEKSSVNFGSLEGFDRKRALYEKIVTHNHPSGSTFSPEDVNMAFGNHVREIRACHSKGCYRLRRMFDTGDYIPKSYLEFGDKFREASSNAFDRANTETWDKYIKSRPLSQINVSDFDRDVKKLWNEYRRQWFIDNAEQYGWEYIEEWFNE